MDQSTSFPRCPGCQQPLAPGRAQGLCPRCLLARAAFAPEPVASAPPAAVPDLAAVAAAFPQLEVLELIGRGGMGVVYRARQRSLNRLVALKLLAPGRERDPAFAERFAREARALAALNHPNIVTVHDFGFAASPAAGGVGGYYFLLMEFVDGVNLRQAMQAGRFTSEQALAIVPPVCAALQFAHERGIVHRDIKPENLLLDKDGRIKIADFGIAKMLGAPVADPASAATGGSGPTDAPERRSALQPEPTQATAAGTPHYMAPEQRDASGRADHRADIYSLGVVLYELLTGELPGARLEPPSHKVQIDVRLDEIVLRALAVQPERRYATAAEFRTQVDTVAGLLGEASRPQPAADRLPRLLKTSGGLLHTPEQLATFAGQFCVWRQRGHLVLDEQRLTFSREGRQTVIPLAAIREVSLAEYPRTMNPAGVDVLRVTYEDAGHTQQVFLAPMDGWFAWPSTWNARVADWHAALRHAVAQVTGRVPAVTPREQVAVPAGHSSLKAFLLAAYVLPMLTVFLVLTLARGGPGNSNIATPILFLGLMLLGGFFGQRLVWRLFQKSRSSSPAISPWSRIVGALLLFEALALGSSWVASRNAQAHAETQGIVMKLQVATAQEADFRAQLAEWTRRTVNSLDEAQRSRDEFGRIRLQRELDSATQRRQELERTLGQRPPQRTGVADLWPLLPLLAGGVWLLLRTGTVASPEATPRRWMRWLGGGLLALGLPLGGLGTWIAFQIAQDTSWNPAPAEALTAFAIWSVSACCLVAGSALLAFARPSPPSAGPRPGSGSTVVIVLTAGLLTALLLLLVRQRSLAPSTPLPAPMKLRP